jgi:mono/diheme cytochrome c family protein
MKRMHWIIAIAAAVFVAPQLMAQPAIFKDADLKLGEQLVSEHHCAACHARRVGGDGSAIYKPQGRINTPAFLRGMVEQCNTELNLGMFPEDVNAVAAVLNRDHYKFK